MPPKESITFTVRAKAPGVGEGSGCGLEASARWAAGGRAAENSGGGLALSARCNPFRALVRFLGLYLLVLILGGVSPAADAPQFSEYQIKGAFLVKFAMFMEWPTDTFPAATTPIVVGILGDDPFGPGFETALRSESAKGRSFVLKRCKNSQEAGECQILFISASENHRLPEILDALKKLPVLTVGDQDRFAQRGGMINFTKEGGKIRFEIRPSAIEAAGLKVSVKLLQVAKVITSAEDERNPSK